MSRARWKPLFIASSVRKALQNPQLDIICMERSTPIVSEFVGRRIYVNNGIRLVPVSVLEEMVGHHVGEFAATRKRPIRPVAKQAKLVSKSSKK